MADTGSPITNAQIASAMQMVVNRERSLGGMFPGYFPEQKHNHYKDYGWPENLTFELLFAMYRRNGIANAGVDKTILKTWQDNPWFLEKERDGSETGQTAETQLEKDIRKRLAKIRFWQSVTECDRRALVGRYSGLILRLADNRQFDEPVDRVPGGLEGLVEVIPAWEGQLTVSEWETDQRSPDYGKPKMLRYDEVTVDQGTQSQPRQFDVHPDRVIIWSYDGTVHGRSLLTAGFNDLLDMEKIKGAGGEGFWKNAKSAPVLNMDKETRLSEVAAMLGVPVTEIADRVNEQVEGWQTGFDKMLMTMGVDVKTLNISLPSPEHFFRICLESFAASIPMPVKILIGSQTGERASTEDANEWSQTIMARRNTFVMPLLMEIVSRLERFGIIPERDWHVDWSDLTESSMDAKIERAAKMAQINAASKDEIIFTGDEIREVIDLEPLSDSDRYRTDEQDEQDALGRQEEVTDETSTG